MLLYITGSYPENQEGIATGAKVLLDAMISEIGRNNFVLLTTDKKVITDNIKKNANCPYILFKDWRLNKNNIKKFYSILDKYNITAIHMEYPGDLYGKTFLASFLPYFTKKYNRRNKKKITYNVRLHEFSRTRFLRKLAILPILKFADRVYVPAKRDREIVSKFMKGNAIRTTIGTNINVVSNELMESDKITISYFGSVYPGKGIKKMLLIWKRLAENDKENKYRFKIIGDIGTESDNHFCDYHRDVWKWIEQYGLKDIVEVTGYISEDKVSKEIQNTQIATLFYEDGLTLRRGSFLAYLTHGIPIVTSKGDEDANELFKGHQGIKMTDTDEEAIKAIIEYSSISKEKICLIHKDNIMLSKSFDWSQIATTFLRDYGEMDY